MKPSRNEPRTITEDEVWYYVNRESVDLVVREPNVFTKTIRLRRAMLQKMLSELHPTLDVKRKR